MTTRELPAALEAESAVLSALLLDPARFEEVLRSVDSADFYHPTNRILFDAMRTIRVEGRALDLVTLKEQLVAQRQLDAIGGDIALAQLADFAATAENVGAYARLMRGASDRRRALGALEDAAAAVRDECLPLGDVLETARDRLAVVPHTAGRLIAETVCLADVQAEPVEWLWPGRIALGKLCAFVGDPGIGKSTLALHLAARVSTGAPMPDGSPGVAGGVVILSAEDGLGDTIRPRLEAAGADLSRIVALTGVRNSRGALRFPTLADLGAIEEALARVHARLLVGDPFMAMLPNSADSHRDQDVRGVLAPLAQLAERTRCAVAIVAHNNKSRGVKALHRAGGSVGIVAAMRSAFVVAADPDDSERRVLACVKSNLAPMPSSLAFRLTAAENGVARVAWLGESKHSADALLAASDASVEASSEPVALAEADAFLRECLRSGARPVTDVEAAARAAGIAKRTLERARSPRRGLVVSLPPIRARGKWRLALAADSAMGDRSDRLADLADSDETTDLGPNSAPLPESAKSAKPAFLADLADFEREAF